RFVPHHTVTSHRPLELFTQFSTESHVCVELGRGPRFAGSSVLSFNANTASVGPHGFCYPASMVSTSSSYNVDRPITANTVITQRPSNTRPTVCDHVQ